MSSAASGSARKVTASKSLGKVLVTGGSGGLASQIIAQLIQRNATAQISTVDLRAPAEPIQGCQYHSGDLTDEAAVAKIFAEVKPDVVIHTASPRFDSPHPIMYKVNVDGTKNLLKIAQEAGVKAFVYTSSASVISDNKTDLVNANEEYPLVIGDTQPEYYTTTKALAETAVIEANRPASHPRFLTCAIRPSGIYGVGDLLVLPGMLQAYYKGQTKFQLGENTNLFDFTDNQNVAHAHHLAATALLTTLEREEQGQARPLEHEKVDGEAFFITNDSPIYFWDFTRSVWRHAGDQTAPSSIWHISKGMALFIATAMEWIFWLLRLGAPNLTRTKVNFSCMTRYYNIDKAKRRLGYRPVITTEQGLPLAVADCIRRGVVPGMPEHLKGSAGGDTKKEK
ncbi:hypothetical protein AAFC00_007304 [Neodothiora populina]|uniref:3-beta hydroxysteroid dehydrogenase/isomerase domain-containing protein n=1 Tax=Neodothiora populina TaxID=2781224 RepID=A0ABR3PHU5_9PEZI